MIIYRVEDEKGGGPYNGERGSMDLLWSIRSSRTYQPGPLDDIPDFKHNRNYRFGFSSMKQLEGWFDPRFFGALAGHGFYIALYDVPESGAKCGGHQCAFNSTLAKLIERRAFKDAALLGLPLFENKSSTPVDNQDVPF